MKKYTWIIIIGICVLFSIVGGTYYYRSYLSEKNAIKYEQELVGDMFMAYCNTSKIVSLYQISIESEFYKHYISEYEGDIPSQKMVANRLLGETTLLGQDILIRKLKSYSGEDYNRTINMIIKSYEGVYDTLQGMKDVEDFDGFKRNMSNFMTSLSVLKDIPDKFKDTEYKGEVDNASLLVGGEMLCNNDVSIDYRDQYM